jgi:flagellar biosynthesis activator protein FlaF
MNVATHAHSLYGQARSLKTPRDLEYEVFARITGQLVSALTASDRQITPALATALHENRRFWTVLAIDLADPNNAFPKELRARLFYLAEVILAATDRILAGSDEGNLLIDLNTAVMRGLRGEVPR